MKNVSNDLLNENEKCHHFTPNIITFYYLFQCYYDPFFYRILVFIKTTTTFTLYKQKILFVIFEAKPKTCDLMILSLLDDDDQINRVSSKLLTRLCFFFFQ